MTAYAWVTEHGEKPLSQKDTAMLNGLKNRHRDIWDHGSGALVFIAEKEALQQKRQEFVDLHQLSCFKCRATTTEWVAGGPRAWGGYWVLCANCVRKPK